MSSAINRGRRRFCGVCSSSAAALVAGLPRSVDSATATPMIRYTRTRLVRPKSLPLHTTDLEIGVNYIFLYPFRSTPCFLLDLGRPLTDSVELTTREDMTYVWRGGVGPNRSIVAFSAICSHRMNHPAPEVSFISYHGPGHHEPTDRGVIHCCSEDSIYDPAQGARVLSGPAPEPLAAIDLEWDAQTDTLYAIGATGGTLFDRFLTKFAFRLAMDYGSRKYRLPVAERSVVRTLETFSHSTIVC